MSRKKKIVFSLVALLVSSVFGLFIVEFLIRVFLPQQESMQWFASSERYGYVLKKTFSQDYRYLGFNFVMNVTTNSYGHRDEEYNPSDFSNPNIKKILILGDSYAFGQGVNLPERFDSLLEHELAKLDKDYLVINCGVGGWGTLQQVKYARDHFHVFQPDMIVLMFCGNDPDDDEAFLRRETDNERGFFYFPGKIFLRDHSHLYRFLYKSFITIRHKRNVEKKLERMPYPKTAEIDTQSASLITDDQWRRTLQIIKDFHEDFLAYNPDGVLIVQSTNPSQQDIRNHLSLLTNGSNLFYVDMKDEVTSLSREDMVLPHDGHWSRRMHMIYAQALYRTIVDLEDQTTNQVLRSQ